jgi:hypothetical protein
MFASPVDAIAYGLRASKVLIHRMVDDLKPGEFDYQPCPGANCIAWVIGHLTATDRRSLTWLGVADLPAVPDGFVERFTVTRTKAGEQTGFGDPKDVIRLFDEHRDRLIQVLPTADPAKLLEPPTFPSPLFSDRGEGLLFMGLHTAMHVGQMSITRRALGYPPVA